MDKKVFLRTLILMIIGVIFFSGCTRMVLEKLPRIKRYEEAQRIEKAKEESERSRDAENQTRKSLDDFNMKIGQKNRAAPIIPHDSVP